MLNKHMRELLVYDLVIFCESQNVHVFDYNVSIVGCSKNALCLRT